MSVRIKPPIAVNVVIAYIEYIDVGPGFPIVLPDPSAGGDPYPSEFTVVPLVISLYDVVSAESEEGADAIELAGQRPEPKKHSTCVGTLSYASRTTPSTAFGPIPPVYAPSSCGG